MTTPEHDRPENRGAATCLRCLKRAAGSPTTSGVERHWEADSAGHRGIATRQLSLARAPIVVRPTARPTHTQNWSAPWRGLRRFGVPTALGLA